MKIISANMIHLRARANPKILRWSATIGTGILFGLWLFNSCQGEKKGYETPPPYQPLPQLSTNSVYFENKDFSEAKKNSSNVLKPSEIVNEEDEKYKKIYSRLSHYVGFTTNYTQADRVEFQTQVIPVLNYFQNLLAKNGIRSFNPASFDFNQVVGKCNQTAGNQWMLFCPSEDGSKKYFVGVRTVVNEEQYKKSSEFGLIKTNHLIIAQLEPPVWQSRAEPELIMNEEFRQLLQKGESNGRRVFEELQIKASNWSRKGNKQYPGLIGMGWVDPRQSGNGAKVYHLEIVKTEKGWELIRFMAPVAEK